MSDTNSNFGYGTITVAPSPASSGTTLSISNGDVVNFPDPTSGSNTAYNIVVWPLGVQPLSSNAEILRVTAKGSADSGGAGNTQLTVTRAQESSSARSIIVGDQIALSITKKVLDDKESLSNKNIVSGYAGLGDGQALETNFIPSNSKRHTYYQRKASNDFSGLSGNTTGGTTIAAGSNGVNTSTFTTAAPGTLNVVSTSGYPAPATITVATAGTDATITYAGKTSTTFTGCVTTAGGGVMSTGGSVVTVNAAQRTVELLIADSMGTTGASTPETRAFPAVYENHMARMYNGTYKALGNNSPVVGFIPVGQGAGAINWDTDTSTGSTSARGLNFANKILKNAGELFTNTESGTAVQFFYTRYQSAGAVAEISLNGSILATTIAAGSNGVNPNTFTGSGTLNVAATASFPSAGQLRIATSGTSYVISYIGKTATTFYGCNVLVTGTGTMATGGYCRAAITSTDPTISGTYSSGTPSAIYINPSAAVWGNLTVTLTHVSGTDFEFEGAYWFNANNTNGYTLIHADRPGLSLNTLNNTSTSNDSILQCVANIQPQIITIILACNDGQTGRTAAQAVSDLTALVTSIRAQYGGTEQQPTIRFGFQYKWVYFTVPSDWLTSWRPLFRQACIDNSILFIDLHEVTGTGFASVGTNFSSYDTLHPNDRGHYAWANALAETFARPANTAARPLLLNVITPQQISSGTAFTSILTLKGTGTSLVVLDDDGTVTGNNSQLGFFGFAGTRSIYSDTVTSAVIKAVADETWSSTAAGAHMEFMTTPNTTLALAVVGGFGNDATFFVGPTQATSKFTVDASGNVTLADAANVVVGTSTGTQIATATTQKLGFYGVTPVVQRSAYTQTYSTADKTHAAPTAATLTDNSAGSANTTLEALTSGSVYATDVAAIRNNFADLAAMVNKNTADMLDTKQMINSIVDDLQALGLVG